MGVTQPKVAQLDLVGGTMLGRYEILRKLATGGMAEIYLARVSGTAGFEKLVVIKRILPEVADDPNFVRMFLDEARLAATLQHPNIADVHEVGEHQGSPFFAMQFVHGQDVRAIRYAARQRKEPVPLSIALAIVQGTASALDYAHDRSSPDGKNLGIVHRDVSSSNILVSYEGAIKLIDFGIARAASHSQQTQVGTLKGKIAYMSPEQCRGQPLDRRSDLFSLGIVMYELTTSRRPFQGANDFAVMEQIVHGRAQAPSTLMRGYPPELEAIVMRLLEPKLADRYQTGEAMLQELDPFLAQHRLWVSAKPLSRFMRAMFSDEVLAADKAVEQGVTLAAYVATSTGPSQKSMLLTPPSSFPAVMPLSQEMPAVHVTGNLLTPSAVFDVPTPEPEPLPVAIAAPTAPERRRSTSWLAVLAIAVVGVGGYFGYTMFMTSEPAAPAAANVAPEQPVAAPAAPVDDSVAAPVEPAPSQPATVEPATVEPAPSQPAIAPREPTVPETIPETVITVNVDKPSVPAPQRGKPVTAKKPKPPPPSSPKEIVPSPPTPVKEPPKSEKEQKKWDLDSPFLPN